MLREYLIGEAMHGAGDPDHAGLAVVATGEPVQRETLLPGAVLCRVAASHLRVGTFQYAAATGDRDVLRALADHAIARHHPEAADAANPYLELYRRVVAAQAELVARWMLVGFVHGVMNTDNTTISGETIDYGPCAFMDAFDPATVFSSIDERGRYAYGNQPAIAQWNLARLGETLLPLIDENADAAVEAATEVVNGFAEAYSGHWARGMAAKLGLAAPDRELVEDLLELMRAQRVDFTLFFRALAAGTARGRCSPSPRRSTRGPRGARRCCRSGRRSRRRWTASTPSTSRATTAWRRRSPRRRRATWRRSCGWSTPSPGRSTSVRGSRTSSGRRPGAAPRTSPTAAPEIAGGDRFPGPDRG